ncbi:MAG: PilZ domain-containing protein [Deltaproteobacteria bacterium]|nr:PilZ domain-containing protein [Deltaproteobacteria bacterium]
MRTERRQSSRIEVKWPVIVQHDKGDMAGETLNFNAISAFIRCPKPLRLNEIFDMTINAPDRRLSVNAEVVWSNIHGRDDEITPRGMGVRFLNMASEDQAFITKALATQSLGKVATEYLRTLEKKVHKNRSGHPLKIQA